LILSSGPAIHDPIPTPTVQLNSELMQAAEGVFGLVFSNWIPVSFISGFIRTRKESEKRVAE
jgi:hypothetical protein